LYDVHNLLKIFGIVPFHSIFCADFDDSHFSMSIIISISAFDFIDTAQKQMPELLLRSRFFQLIQLPPIDIDITWSE